ncbi:RHS repeat domain-containing protein [Facilibium subflavum]|uniref:RHS repeat domain-containing protein n=1 Tax=Facilibium subflavum TaxID=2219058 RepID=UPI000E65DD10|nr:RHS repeat-associated core domain-containing protein [Facilibium subflavum]
MEYKKKNPQAKCKAQLKPVVIGLMAAMQLMPWQTVQASTMLTQTTSTMTYSYHYDKNGNLVETDKNEVTQYQYDYNSLNRLVLVTDVINNKTYTYQYYADGRRAAKVDKAAGQSIDFYYGQNGKLLNEALTIDQVQTKISSYFVGSRFIKDLQNTNNSQLTESLGVRHNQPASIVLKNGVSQTTSYHIDDYGQLSNSNDENQTSNQDSFDFEQNPYIFGAGYHDFETGLNDQGARYYNADIARFVAQDSFDLLNRYNYANGNPVMNYDPSGHFSLSSLIPHDNGGIANLGVQFGAQALVFGVSAGIGVAGGPVGAALFAGAFIGGSAGVGGLLLQGEINNEKIDGANLAIAGGLGAAFGMLDGSAGFKLGAKMASLKASNAELTQERNKLRVNVLQADNNGYQRGVNEGVGIRQELANQNQVLEQQKAKLQAALRVKDAENTRLMQEKSGMQEINKDLLEQVQTMGKEKASLQEASEKQLGELQSIRKGLAENQGVVEGQRKVIRTQAKAKSDLQQQVTSQQQRIMSLENDKLALNTELDKIKNPQKTTNYIPLGGGAD